MKTIARLLAPLLTLLVLGCSAAGLRSGEVPSLEIYYVEDSFGGAPLMSSVSFYSSGRVEIFTVGERRVSRRLNSTDAKTIRSILDSKKFQKLLSKLEDDPVQRPEPHGSFVGLASSNFRVENVIPELQLEIWEIPVQLKAYLEELEQIVLSNFSERRVRSLHPRITGG